MLRLLLIPLLPVFVMLVKSMVDDALQAKRERKAVKPKKKAPEPTLYEHKWEDDE